ncbi:hypothetical protein QJS66_06580 [Kocuria rhizophila]|nr:hypothetical protein QJS66_06580 [Kocuria rhizophila]
MSDVGSHTTELTARRTGSSCTGAGTAVAPGFSAADSQATEVVPSPEPGRAPPEAPHALPSGGPRSCARSRDHARGGHGGGLGRPPCRRHGRGRRRAHHTPSTPIRRSEQLSSRATSPTASRPSRTSCRARPPRSAPRSTTRWSAR